MQAHIIEVRAGATVGTFWVLKPDAFEWLRYPVTQLQLRGVPLLQLVGGMDRDTLIVMDLGTGRGGVFQPGESAEASLAESPFDVSPLFEPFVDWLLAWSREDGLEALPQTLELAAVAASWR